MHKYNTQQQQEGHHRIYHFPPFDNHHGTSCSASQASPCSLRMTEGDATNCSCCCSWQARFLEARQWQSKTSKRRFLHSITHGDPGVQGFLESPLRGRGQVEDLWSWEELNTSLQGNAHRFSSFDLVLKNCKSQNSGNKSTHCGWAKLYHTVIHYVGMFLYLYILKYWDKIQGKVW